MATITSSKPGEIGGTSVLSKRSPTYRLVLKVDPTTGQYKYEYEINEAPKVSDIIPNQIAPIDPIDDSVPKDPSDPKVETSFEQTKKALAGGGEGRGRDRGAGTVSAEDQGYGYSGTPGEGGSGTFQNPKFGNKGDVFTPGPGIGKAYDQYGRLRNIGISNDLGLNLYDKAYPVAKAAKDYVSTGGIVGLVKKGVDSLFGEKKEKTTSGQGAPSDIPAEDRFKSFEKTKEDLGGTADLGSTRGLFSDLTAARNNIDNQIAELEEDNKSPFAPRTFNENKIKDLQEQRKSLGERLSTQATTDAGIQDVTEQMKSLGLKFKGQPINVAMSEIDTQKAKNTLQDQGLQYTGQSFEEAQKDVQKDIREKFEKKQIKDKEAKEVSDTLSFDAQKTYKDLKDKGFSHNDAMDRSENTDKVKNMGSIGTGYDSKTGTYGGTLKDSKGNDVKTKDNRSQDDKDRTQRTGSGFKSDKEKDTSTGKFSGGGGSDSGSSDSKGDKNTGSKDKNKGSDKGTMGDDQRQSGGSTGGGGGGGRVICTELYRQGFMTKEDWVLDLWYTQNYLSRRHIIGYWYYAIPMVKIMRKNKLITNIWKHIAINRTQDIKWRLNKGKFNLLGRVYSIALETTANILGYFVEEKDYKILYKGER